MGSDPKTCISNEHKKPYYHQIIHFFATTKYNFWQSFDGEALSNILFRHRYACHLNNKKQSKRLIFSSSIIERSIDTHYVREKATQRMPGYAESWLVEEFVVAIVCIVSLFSSKQGGVVSNCFSLLMKLRFSFGQ